MQLARAAALSLLVLLAAACGDSRPIEDTAQAAECSRCHGYPPTALSSGGTHPVNANCSQCHPATVEDDDVTIIPGGAHLNGVVDRVQSHPVPYPDHFADALASIGSCASCHGADYGGSASAPSCNGCHEAQLGFADWKTNCTFCHGTRTPGETAASALAAPPESVEGGGDQTNANPDVGAHQVHLTGDTLSDGFACSTCHAVPNAALALAHFSGRTAPATVAFDALATQGAAGATYTGGTCAVYCHGNGSSWPTGSVAANATPAWTATGLACNACHASRPATGGAMGHLSSTHRYLGAGTSSGPEVPCASCHLGYEQDATVNAAYHVNGTRTVAYTNRGGEITVAESPGWSSCTPCHYTGPLGNPLAGDGFVAPP